MTNAELVSLIEGGVAEKGGRWADLGAGEGAFTLALAGLLGPSAHIVAVDKDARALRAIGHGIETRTADFTKPLDLRDLDGIVMANSLHYVRDKQPVLELVHAMLRPSGRPAGVPMAKPWGESEPTAATHGCPIRSRMRAGKRWRPGRAFGTRRS